MGKDSRDTIRIYVRRRKEPEDVEKMMLGLAKAFSNFENKIFMNMSLSAASSGFFPKAGELASYFDGPNLTSMWSAKMTAREFNCDYEFIDVATGDLLEIDNEFPPIKDLRKVGNRLLTKTERNLPIPCCTIRDQVLDITWMGNAGLPSIKGFYLKVIAGPELEEKMRTDQEKRNLEETLKLKELKDKFPLREKILQYVKISAVSEGIDLDDIVAKFGKEGYSERSIQLEIFNLIADGFLVETQVARYAPFKNQ